LKYETLIDEVVKVDMPTELGDFKLHGFQVKNTNQEHLALVKVLICWYNRYSI
jgi:3,4-dihydroxy 2-butanone 4-phosphate synthase/GTP cyclohydrolase II